jgi:hypothetical protein
MVFGNPIANIIMEFMVSIFKVFYLDIPKIVTFPDLFLKKYDNCVFFALLRSKEVEKRMRCSVSD